MVNNAAKRLVRVAVTVVMLVSLLVMVCSNRIILWKGLRGRAKHDFIRRRGHQVQSFHGRIEGVVAGTRRCWRHGRDLRRLLRRVRSTCGRAALDPEIQLVEQHIMLCVISDRRIMRGSKNCVCWTFVEANITATDDLLLLWDVDVVDVAAERCISNKMSLHSTSFHLSGTRRTVDTFLVDVGSATEGAKMLDVRRFTISGEVEFTSHDLVRAHLTLGVLGQKVEYLNSRIK